MTTQETVVDKEMTQAVDGSPIMERDVQKMVRFFHAITSILSRKIFLLQAWELSLQKNISMS
ncbi:MAG: hypothetical protein LVR00_06250 [Rhabdochlamydiaceae bacterium]